MRKDTTRNDLIEDVASQIVALLAVMVNVCKVALRHAETYSVGEIVPIIHPWSIKLAPGGEILAGICIESICSHPFRAG